MGDKIRTSEREGKADNVGNNVWQKTMESEFQFNLVEFTSDADYICVNNFRW